MHAAPNQALNSTRCDIKQPDSVPFPGNPPEPNETNNSSTPYHDRDRELTMNGGAEHTCIAGDSCDHVTGHRLCNDGVRPVMNNGENSLDASHKGERLAISSADENNAPMTISPGDDLPIRMAGEVCQNGEKFSTCADDNCDCQNYGSCIVPDDYVSQGDPVNIDNSNDNNSNNNNNSNNKAGNDVSVVTSHQTIVDNKNKFNLETRAPSLDDVRIKVTDGSRALPNGHSTVEPAVDSEANVKKSKQPAKWTGFSFLKKMKQKSAKTTGNSKQLSQSNGSTVSDKLPEVRHESTVHTANHDNSGSSEKKLTFQHPVSAEDEEDKDGSGNNTTVTSDPNSKSGISPFQRLTKHLTLSPFSTNAQQKQTKKKPQQPVEVVKSLPPVHLPLSDKKEGALKPGEGECGCGQCKCLTPLSAKFQQWWRRDDTIEGKEIRNTLVVGVAFQLIFTAHYAIQNLQSSLNEEQYLGASALGCLYASSIFSSIFAPTIIGILGTKGCLVLAWLTHLLYTLAQFYPTWQTLVPAAVLLGALTGPTWTAQGLYVSACAFSFSKRSPHSPYTILSRFNGLFFTLYETRQILGNVLSSAVLKDGVGNKSEEVIFKFCGPRDCPYAENVTDIEEPDRVVIDAMLGIYMALQVLALVLTIVFVTPLSRSEWSSHAPVRETLTSWFKTLVGTRMLFLVPFMVFQAMEQGLLLSEYTKSFISCPIGIHMVGFVMATHGGISAIFVFVFSRLARRTGRYPLFALAAVISLALMIVLYDWTPESDQEALIFFFPALFGVAQGIWQTQTNSMIAVVFWDRKEPAFANYHTWRAVGFTLIFSFHSLLCVSTKIAITLSFLIVGMVLYTAVELYSRWKERIRLPKLEGTDVSKSETTVPDSPRSDFTGENPSSTNFYDVQLNITSAESEDGEGGTNASGFGVLRFEDSDVENEGQLTLDGTYLSRGESAFLDNDLRRYGIVPLTGSRPLTVAQLSTRTASEGEDRWVVKLKKDSWGSSSLESSPELPTRPRTWHEDCFQDEGELQVQRTNGDVFVY